LLIIIKLMGVIVSGRRGAVFFVVLAGLIAGMGAGIKLVFVVYALSLLFSFFIIPVSGPRKWVLALYFGVGLAVGFLLADGAWVWRVWHQMGNPIYPMMNNIFHGQLAPFAPIRDYRFLPNGFFEKLCYPVVFTFNSLRVGDGHSIKQISWLIVYLVSIYFILSQTVRFLFKKENSCVKPEVKYLLSFFWVAFFLWVNVFGVYRYLITIEILIPLVVFVLLLSQFKRNVWVSLIAVLMLGVVTMINFKGIPDWGRSNWGAKVFRLETTWAQKERIACVVLIGRPLAWIIPALDLKAPVIQIMPGFPVNEAYSQRARSILKSSRNGKTLVIFQPWVISPDKAKALLNKYDFDFKKEGCTIEKGYIETKKIFFMFCSAQEINER